MPEPLNASDYQSSVPGISASPFRAEQERSEASADNFEYINTYGETRNAIDPSSLLDDLYGREVSSESNAKSVLGLIDLFFRPGRFFRTSAAIPNPLIFLMVAWMTGIAMTIDRLEGRMLRHELGIQTRFVNSLIHDYRDYWLFLIIMGMITATLYYCIGGWWYRTRLSLSGAENPDPWTSRIVYIYSYFIIAFPTLLFALWETARYSTPIEAWYKGHPFTLVSMILPFWSMYVSYRGVRTVFSVRKGAARIWFVGLPASIYAFAILALFIPSELLDDILQSKPAVSIPNTYESSSLTFDYPSNWYIDENHASFDPNVSIPISSRTHDVSIRINLLPQDAKPDVVL